MSGTDERRQEVRALIPTKIFFNLLGSATEFIRGSSLPTTTMAQMDTAADLEGRDELERYLKRLDDKLNFVISILTEQMTKKDYTYKGAVLDLSESGLKLVSPLKLKVGDALEIGLMLSSQSYRTMDIAGEVTWVEDYRVSTGKGGDVVAGVRFTDILSQDQDEIVHWIFQKQREEIRRSRNQD
jgi:hypothetical protein